MRTLLFSLVLAALCSGLLNSCNSKPRKKDHTPKSPVKNEPLSQKTPDFYYGADLSYVNELEDCGAAYYDDTNTQKDPYRIFKDYGANLIRLRLWHDPQWTRYSTLPDVIRSISRAKELKIPVLLDFHYSDDWADPQKQEIPKAWKDQLNDTQSLGNTLYEYTYHTLDTLYQQGLLPEMVQVGNEINGMILRTGEAEDSINWVRNSYLLNKGIEAVRKIAKDTGKEIQVMLHIAQPENALKWFEEAKENGVTDYDWIGVSYYPLWSEYTLNNLGEALTKLIADHNKKLMIVETAYPYTLENADSANNILGEEALIDGYPSTQKGQLEYLLSLKEIIQEAGGQGLVYWEPAWISSSCETRWGKGSHWDNATLFDQNGKVTLGMNFYYNNLGQEP